jgi:hypothetical protein
MALIRKDEIGLYVSAGGWVTRPLVETQYREGQDVTTHHYGTTSLAGVGKDEHCKRGEYVEIWITTGVVAGHPPKRNYKSDGKPRFYSEMNLKLLRKKFEDAKISAHGNRVGSKVNGERELYISEEVKCMQQECADQPKIHPKKLKKKENCTLQESKRQ